MKNRVNPLIPLIMILIGAITTIFLLLDDWDSSFIFILPMVLLLIVTGGLLLWERNIKEINDEEIHLESKDGKNFHIVYGDYQIDCVLDNNPNENMIPKKDINGKTISYTERRMISNYLMNNYDMISLPEDVTPVKIKEAKNYFEDLVLCDENQKKELLAKTELQGTFPSIIFVIIIFLIIGPGFLFDSDLHPAFLVIVILNIVSLVYGLFLRIRNHKDLLASDFYYQKVKVYDSKKAYEGEGDVYYYIRICDNKKHVLTKWFFVSKRFYENGQTGTLFINDNEAYFIAD